MLLFYLLYYFTDIVHRVVSSKNCTLLREHNRVGVSTTSKICKEICYTIWNVLRNEFMKIPDNESEKF